MNKQKIIILDFGSQTTQLIGRRVRELDTFCEILPYNKFPVGDESVIGVILSGSPYSVHDPEAFKVDLSQFVGKVPVLGICYGAQFISYANGGKVEKAPVREYGKTNTFIDGSTDKSLEIIMEYMITLLLIITNFQIIISLNMFLKIKISIIS